MTRSKPFTFIDLHNENDPEDESRKMFCRLCEEYTGKLQKLVPRYIDGILDDKFKQCSWCGQIFPIYEVKLYTEYEPKAQAVRNPFETGTKVVAIERKRKYKQKKYGRAIDSDQEVPPLAGKPDRELRSMLEDRTGTLNYINDDDIK